jgi:hemerythrin
MPFIEWEEDFQLGITQFDKHHKHLLALINQIYDDYTTEAPSETIGSVLNELIDYATYHFATEENWMEDQNYPQLDKHSEEHDRFSKTVLEMQKEFSQGKLNLSIDILIFLKNWLTDHILKTDAEYGRYVASKGIPFSLV